MKNKYAGVLYICKKTYGTIYLKLTFFTFAFWCVDAECRESLTTMKEPSPGNVKVEKGSPDFIKLCFCPFSWQNLHISQLLLVIFLIQFI